MRMAASLRQDLSRCQQLFRQDRQLADAQASRVKHGVRYGRRHAHGTRLANTLAPVGLASVSTSSTQTASIDVISAFTGNGTPARFFDRNRPRRGSKTEASIAAMPQPRIMPPTN
jgi:hypothetical protein